MNDFELANELLNEFKGNSYIRGNGVLERIGRQAAAVAKTAALIYTEYPGVDTHLKRITGIMQRAGLQSVTPIQGAAPNAPRDDLLRITSELAHSDAQLVVSFGGGSTIDVAKAAEVLRTLGGSVDAYFGTNLVSQAITTSGKRLRPHMAIQTAAGTGAHLTKYSNITDTASGQKMLIVDPAIVPAYPVFDFDISFSSPISLTCDGALDGVAHVLEVLFGAIGKPHYAKAEAIAGPAIRLILENLPKVLSDPKDAHARTALCHATDLGGYAIMIGGTNGPHLTSFSLVEVLSHGRACAIMNPYYAVFFAPHIEAPLRFIASLYKQAGYLPGVISGMSARQLGVAVAEAMFAFARRIGFPTRLADVPGFTDDYIHKALNAAKDPQLKMKLENMPVPLTPDTIDEYMGPILEAARNGDLSLIKNVPTKQ